MGRASQLQLDRLSSHHGSAVPVAGRRGSNPSAPMGWQDWWCSRCSLDNWSGRTTCRGCGTKWQAKPKNKGDKKSKNKGDKNKEDKKDGDGDTLRQLKDITRLMEQVKKVAPNLKDVAEFTSEKTKKQFYEAQPTQARITGVKAGLARREERLAKNQEKQDETMEQLKELKKEEETLKQEMDEMRSVMEDLAKKLVEESKGAVDADDMDEDGEDLDGEDSDEEQEGRAQPRGSARMDSLEQNLATLTQQMGMLMGYLAMGGMPGPPQPQPATPQPATPQPVTPQPSPGLSPTLPMPQQESSPEAPWRLPNRIRRANSAPRTCQDSHRRSRSPILQESGACASEDPYQQFGGDVSGEQPWQQVIRGAKTPFRSRTLRSSRC